MVSGMNMPSDISNEKWDEYEKIIRTNLNKKRNNTIAEMHSAFISKYKDWLQSRNGTETFSHQLQSVACRGTQHNRILFGQGHSARGYEMLERRPEWNVHVPHDDISAVHNGKDHVEEKRSFEKGVRIGGLDR
jgi:hypothetical protein